MLFAKLKCFVGVFLTQHKGLQLKRGKVVNILGTLVVSLSTKIINQNQDSSSCTHSGLCPTAHY